MPEGDEVQHVHVLLKVWADDSADSATVYAVYETRADLEARVERIGKANSQYRLRRLGENRWRVGPEDDESEGFFGHQPIDLVAVTAKFHRSSRHDRPTQKA